MEGFVRGDVVVLDFPFSDLTQFKRRPALVLKVPKGEDLIICQITAKPQEKSVEVPLNSKDFITGGLKKDSYVRIDKITSIKSTRVKYKIGSLKVEKFKEILDSIVSFLKE
ncbi:MAG: type II toxin-antitoxin system PemK/MazF family toxin [Nanoarchaeota archaeon]